MDFGKFAIAALQLMVFMMFVTAVIEVIKGVSAKGLVGIVKEVVKGLFKNQKLSEETIKTLNFVVALIFLRAFEYGAMSRLLNIDTVTLGPFAYWLDYIATASVIYMGADYIFSWYWKIKNKADEVAGKTTTKTTETIQSSSTEKTVQSPTS
jgi:hypothetical protein